MYIYIYSLTFLGGRFSGSMGGVAPWRFGASPTHTLFNRLHIPEKKPLNFPKAYGIN